MRGRGEGGGRGKEDGEIKRDSIKDEGKYGTNWAPSYICCGTVLVASHSKGSEGKALLHKSATQTSVFLGVCVFLYLCICVSVRVCNYDTTGDAKGRECCDQMQ